MSRIRPIEGNAEIGAIQECVGVVTIINGTQVTVEAKTAGGDRIEWTFPHLEASEKFEQGALITIRLEVRRHSQDALRNAVVRGDPADGQYLSLLNS